METPFEPHYARTLFFQVINELNEPIICHLVYSRRLNTFDEIDKLVSRAAQAHYRGNNETFNVSINRFLLNVYTDSVFEEHLSDLRRSQPSLKDYFSAIELVDSSGNLIERVLTRMYFNYDLMRNDREMIVQNIRVTIPQSMITMLDFVSL